MAELPRWAGRAGLQALCPSKLAACCPSQLPNKKKERMAGPSRVYSAGANGLASLGFGVGRGNIAGTEGVDAHSLPSDSEEASRVPGALPARQKSGSWGSKNRDIKYRDWESGGEVPRRGGGQRYPLSCDAGLESSEQGPLIPSLPCILPWHCFLLYQVGMRGMKSRLPGSERGGEQDRETAAFPS